MLLAMLFCLDEIFYEILLWDVKIETGYFNIKSILKSKI